MKDVTAWTRQVQITIFTSSISERCLEMLLCGCSAQNNKAGEMLRLSAEKKRNREEEEARDFLIIAAGSRAPKQVSLPQNYAKRVFDHERQRRRQCHTLTRCCCKCDRLSAVRVTAWYCDFDVGLEKISLRSSLTDHLCSA